MRRRFRIALGMGVCLIVSAAVASGQVWTPIANQPVVSPSNPLLLTDGTVIIHNACDVDWWRLTPDSSGSYRNGTWSQIASLPSNYGPLYFASAVLPDGRVIVEGGEYNFCVPVWTTQGAIYDPLANSWTSVAPPSGWNTIGDAQATVLADGQFMLADCCSKKSALFDATNLTWLATGAGKFTINDEENWTLLPDGKVLAVDAYVGSYDPDGTNSELYDPASGTWSSAGSTIVQLWDSYPDRQHASYEVGPAPLLPDGTVFATGANGAGAAHTAIYNTKNGKWTPGPDFPDNLGIADGPAAVLPNGHVLLQTGPLVFLPPSVFFEWDGQSLTEVPAAPGSEFDPSYAGNMLVLPTGEVLWTDFTNIFLYSSSGGPKREWEPRIVNGPPTRDITRGNTYSLTGQNFAGWTQGAYYGDDSQAATNFPLVRLTNKATHHVFYARTHDFSTMGVAEHGPQTTKYDVPANMETGPTDVVVVTNGIPSRPITVVVH